MEMMNRAKMMHPLTEVSVRRRRAAPDLLPASLPLLAFAQDFWINLRLHVLRRRTRNLPTRTLARPGKAARVRTGLRNLRAVGTAVTTIAMSHPASLAPTATVKTTWRTTYRPWTGNRHRMTMRRRRLRLPDLSRPRVARLHLPALRMANFLAVRESLTTIPPTRLTVMRKRRCK